MAGVIWSERARNDLREIVDYISLSNPAAAQVLSDKVFSGTDRLGDFPHLGREVPEVRKHLVDCREIIVMPCRVIYQVVKGDVHILRVIRTERALRLYMIGGDIGRKRVLHEE